MPKSFNIKKTVSIKEWKSSTAWKTLKAGLDENVGGVADAVNEAYALVKKSIDSNLSSSDTFGLHHEVSEDGSVVLNKFALSKVAADISTSKTLTEADKVIARTHLLKHYQEIEENPPSSLVEGEMSMFDGTIEEMKPGDIPLAPGVDLEALKVGDDDPLEVVVSVPAGKSKRGWNYMPSALQSIVNFVSGETAPGYLGHQKPEEVDTQFPSPVTHWVGAMFKDNVAYFRGVVDKVAPDLKRWVRSKRVTQVSIFGIPTQQIIMGEVQVVDYKLISIDWTPLHRAGMPSTVVAMGEMAGLTSTAPALLAFDGSHEGLREVLMAAIRNRYKDEGYTWIHRVFDNHIIIEHEPKSGGSALYKVDYVVVDEKVQLGDNIEKVIEERVYLPAGEMEEIDTMTLQEMVAAIRSAMVKKETDLGTVVGELGFTNEQAVELLAGEKMAQLTKAAEFGAKLATSLGMTEGVNTETALTVAGEMSGVWDALGFNQSKPEKPAEVVGEMAKAQAKLAEDAHDKLLVETIDDKVSGEQAQLLVKRMIKVEQGATKEQICGEIDSLLNDESLKSILGKSFLDKPSTGGSGSEKSDHKHLKTKSASI